MTEPARSYPTYRDVYALVAIGGDAPGEVVVTGAFVNEVLGMPICEPDEAYIVGPDGVYRFKAEGEPC